MCNHSASLNWRSHNVNTKHELPNLSSPPGVKTCPWARPVSCQHFAFLSSSSSVCCVPFYPGIQPCPDELDNCGGTPMIFDLKLIQRRAAGDLAAGQNAAMRDRIFWIAQTCARNANAAGEERTPDLRIMRPTRCQLRYCRLPSIICCK